MKTLQIREASQSLHKVMGVINLTPDSFSDGGLIENKDHLINQINLFRKHKTNIFDFGAESTAPFNPSITEDEEKKRLTPLLKYLKTLEKDSLTISLDTYKPEIAHWFFTDLKWNYGIWNDVSGLYDESVQSFLARFNDHKYIYCHNNAPKRSLTSEHMDYVNDEPILVQLNNFFRKVDSLEFKNRIIIDPCFGFSKSYEQNWAIIDSWCDLLESFSKQTVVFGVSKKSFMRKKVKEQLGDDSLDKEDSFYYSELLHYNLINSLKRLSHCETWIRAHDPRLVHLALA